MASPARLFVSTIRLFVFIMGEVDGTLPESDVRLRKDGLHPATAAEARSASEDYNQCLSQSPAANR